MNFLTEHCLFQTLLLSAIIQNNDETILTRLASLYALEGKEQANLNKILHNNTFVKLASSTAVILHENFLRAFCIDKIEFGNEPTEWDALEIKRNAYTLFENLGAETNDFFDAFVVAANKNDKLTVTLALLYYLNEAKSEVYLPLLRRAAGHSNAEATILLMAFEKERKTTLFEKLCNSKELLLANDDTLILLAKHYRLENNLENIKGVKSDD